MIREQSLVDPKAYIRDWMAQADEQTRELTELFLSDSQSISRYLFGCNEYSHDLSNVIPVDGFVDDFKKLPATINSKPVVRSENVPSNAVVINCSFSGFPVTANKKISSLDIRGKLSASDIFRCFPSSVPLPDFVSDMRQDMLVNERHWQQLFQRMVDPDSKKVLMDVVRFRLTGDGHHMVDYRYRPEEQYFEPYLNLGDGEVFVDGGGYTGDTAEEFCKRVPGYSKIFLFEPSETNIERARKRLAAQQNIEYIQQGLSHSVGTLRFNPDQGSASAVADEGTVEILVTTLDEAVKEKTTFIKTDLEGWDIEALKGARGHIRDYHPKLAISVYHQAIDFWRIPEFVLAIRDDYELRLQHYTEGWSETIMFFVPK